MRWPVIRSWLDHYIITLNTDQSPLTDLSGGGKSPCNSICLIVSSNQKLMFNFAFSRYYRSQYRSQYRERYTSKYMIFMI